VSLLARALEELSRALDCDWALVGGLAVSSWAEPRLTRDIDVAVAVTSDSEAEKIVADLIARGYETAAVVEQSRTGRIATARMRPPRSSVGAVVVDLLFASAGIESEIVAGSQWIEVLDGCRVRVARPGHLFAMKVLSRDDDARPQDRIDLASLGAILSEEEVAVAERAVCLIVERGFHRQKDLRADLAEAIARFRGASPEKR
jgi:hypothetical protein